MFLLKDSIDNDIFVSLCFSEKMLLFSFNYKEHNQVRLVSHFSFTEISLDFYQISLAKCHFLNLRGVSDFFSYKLIELGLL